ncbi:hypothetical protein [uncultured Marinobacter sp.]|uniref:hypothetical protein n=1 Tax=uncultured Marinobacter sp. TaxID=187379 RepID=UPI0025919AFD|nr:hypothetical protein [uncultured Marinobacter sp.]
MLVQLPTESREGEGGVEEPRVDVPEEEVQAGPAAVLVTQADSQPASCSDVGKLISKITEIVPTGNSPGASGNIIRTTGHSLHDAQLYLESCVVGTIPFPVRRRSVRVTPHHTTEETLGAVLPISSKNIQRNSYSGPPSDGGAEMVLSLTSEGKENEINPTSLIALNIFHFYHNDDKSNSV